MNTSLSIFAKALASENLSFSFDKNAETASFDTKSRHLILPVWDVSETLQTMLIAHEIGHALWTPYKESDELLKAAEAEGFHIPLLQRIANTVEDVRIEKLMKDKYPGTRRDFFLGYKEIVDTDMFSFSKVNFAEQTLLNKLNMHFKWGVPGFIDVPLDADEMEIADIIDNVVTFPQVIAVAKALYKHPKMEKVVQEYEQHLSEGDMDGAETMLKEMTTDADGVGTKTGEKYAASSICFTGMKNVMDGIIDSKTVIKDFETYQYGNPPLVMDEYRKFVKESDAFVRQLVAQFERRKAADEIRRERPKQTGLLNMDKLHQYRTHDDIFISKIIKQDGKNHGIVFLLDFSGSMSHSLKDCFLQVLQLVWFCEKAKIPFEVFGFTDIGSHVLERLGSKLPFMPEMARKCATGALVGPCKLITLASSRDDASTRETLLAYLYECLVLGTRSRPSLISLGGTPTVEAVAIASQFMVDWVQTNNIQIPTLMVVTDGQPNGVTVSSECVGTAPVLHYYHNGQGSLTVMNEVLGTAERLNLADYSNVCIGNMTLATMFRALRKSLNARCVGMFVGANNLTERDFHAFCLSNKERDMVWARQHKFTMTDSPRFKAAKEAYADGAIIVHADTFPGYDSFFLIRTPKIVVDADATNTSGNFTKVKNTFIKTMGKRSCSRVFLSRYIDIVAGQPVKGMVDAIYNHPVM